MAGSKSSITGDDFYGMYDAQVGTCNRVLRDKDARGLKLGACVARGIVWREFKRSARVVDLRCSSCCGLLRLCILTLLRHVGRYCTRLLT
jgi:hypothetical protein